MERITVSTRARSELVDVTAQVEAYLERNAGRGWKDGFVCVHSPHTTCAVTINEGYDPDVKRDMARFLAHLVPEGWDFRHAEGNSDSHVKTSLFGAHCLVPVVGGRLALGTWQTVYLCEFDGPRTRSLLLSFVKAEEDSGSR